MDFQKVSASCRSEIRAEKCPLSDPDIKAKILGYGLVLGQGIGVGFGLSLGVGQVLAMRRGSSAMPATLRSYPLFTLQSFFEFLLSNLHRTSPFQNDFNKSQWRLVFCQL